MTIVEADMIDFTTFEKIRKIEGIRYAGSEYENSPLHDPNITIFFHNGYRLISAKSTLGQTIELEPFDEKLLNSAMPTFKAFIFHDIAEFKHKPENEIFELQNDIKIPIDISTFAQKITDIVGEEVKNFLQERHESIPFRTFTNRLK